MPLLELEWAAGGKGSGQKFPRGEVMRLCSNFSRVSIEFLSATSPPHYAGAEPQYSQADAAIPVCVARR